MPILQEQKSVMYRMYGMPILQEQKSVMYRMYGMPILQEQKSVKSHFQSFFELPAGHKYKGLLAI